MNSTRPSRLGVFLASLAPSRGRRRYPLALGLGAGVCSHLLAGVASAQNITIGTNVTRTLSKRESTEFPYYVSQNDCNSKDEFEFPLTIPNFKSGPTLEVWIGEGSANCKEY